MRIIGIYKIRNTVNNKVYVGSSINIELRRYVHFSTLKHNKHENSYLQRAYNKYGHDNFLFEIIEIVENPENLIKQEDYWINTLRANDRNYGYNLRKNAENNLGIKHKPMSEERKKNLSEKFSGDKNPNFGKKHTIKTKNKMSENHANVEGENNPFFGKKHSEESKIKSALNRKLTTDKITVLKIKELLKIGTSVSDIIKQLNVGEYVVYRVKNGKYDKIYNLN